MTSDKNYWNSAYRSINRFKTTPSQFAAFVLNELDSEESLIYEFGCGNGRDALFFYQHGKKVIALDGSETIINLNEVQSEENLKFKYFRFTKESCFFKKKVKAVIYSRFFLHSIPEDYEHSILINLSNFLETGSRVFFEYRNNDDQLAQKEFGNHYRRFINSKVLNKKLTDLGFEIVYQISGQGFAKYKDEDAHVSRVVAVKI